MSEDEVRSEGEMGQGAEEYAGLEAEANPEPTAKEFYAGLAVDVQEAGQVELAESIKHRIAKIGDRLLPTETPGATGSWNRPATEKEARDSIKTAIEDALRYLKDPDTHRSSTEDEESGSSTMADLNLGEEFDARIGAELMELFGSTGQKVGEPIEEWEGRFARTTYNTVIPGVVLRRWRHHPSGTKKDTPEDFEKFYLAKLKG